MSNLRRIMMIKQKGQTPAASTKFQPSSGRVLYEQQMAAAELSRPNWKLIGGVTVGVVALGGLIFFLRG